ncbi:AraC family transcriptional regulator [Novosphingobium sp. YJ-S2-02]|uniref:AraC family transcriptional regulator n=1 Tax=Novosphingobium aureum TaxID=2792964 RepID=A0A931MJV0_9SPHN|nr:AraC family transcriptional regulator [Novosphingobium aureum]MBH0111880.1 AraC family transcriptional regulator [Novosphingobium aureum]
MLTATDTSGRTALRDFKSTNADEIVDFVGKQLAPHALDIFNPAQMDVNLRCMNVGDAQLVDIRYGSEVVIEPIDLDSHFLIHAALSGRTEICSAGVQGLIQPDNLYITCPGRTTRIRMTDQCQHLTVKIAQSAFEDYLTQCLHIPVNRPVLFHPGNENGRELPQVWRNLLQHLIMQMEFAPGLISAQHTQRQYAMLMVEMLLNHYCNTYSDQIALHGNDVAPWHVRRAREIIHDSIEEAISVSDLAVRVGVSVRSLQNGFRQFLGQTPVEYVRRHRLEKLHATLARSDPKASVTEMMLDCGIVNFGRYAQYYRQQYGCSPSQTLRNRRR